MNNRIKYLQVDALSSFLFVAALSVLLLLNNGFYIFFPTLIFFVLFYYLHQPFKASIFTIILLQHYVNIVAGVIECNYLGKDINYNTLYRSDAIILSSIGLLALLLPVLYYQNKQPNYTLNNLVQAVQQFSIPKLIRAYLISYFIASFLGAIAFVFGGLTQIIFWLVSVKWILFLMMGFVCFLRNEKKNLFFIFVLLEFISGFFSFFSDFKAVIYFFIALVLTLFDKIDGKKMALGTLAGVILVSMGVVWTNIKGEYRAFLNGGSGKQEVNTNSEDALNKLYSLSNNVDQNAFQNSVTDFLDRLQYTYFFSKAMETIPDKIPFQGGQNWLDNLAFTTTPRFLNADKPVLDQTEKTKKYTGLHLSGKDKGTSFSLGYFAECYVDFGRYEMFSVLVVIGIIYGIFYNYLLSKSSYNILFNYAAAISFFMEFKGYEMDGTYLLGRLFSGMLTYWALAKFFFPTLLSYIMIDDKDTI